MLDSSDIKVAAYKQETFSVRNCISFLKCKLYIHLKRKYTLLPR